MNSCTLAYTFYEADTRVRRYATTLARRGDQVDAIALRAPDQPYETTLDGVTVFHIQPRTINEKSSLVYLFRILRFLLHATIFITRRHLRNPYQFIHVHSVPDFLVFAALPARLMGARVILDIHDILPEFYEEKFHAKQSSWVFSLLLLVEKLSFAAADHVIVANHLWRERLISRATTASKCTAICNYPIPEVFFPRPKANGDEIFKLLYPGTLNWHQGLDTAIKAFGRISDQLPQAEFHIYGEGPAKSYLQDLVKSLKLDSKVIFHKLQPLEKIAEIMAMSDLAVVPKRASSKFGNEAASTKIMEFMASGVPVIVSRTKVDTYYFNDSLVKFFESENDGDLAEAIVSLYRNPQLRQQLVQNATRYVEQNTWAEKGQEYLRLVNSLVYGSSNPSEILTATYKTRDTR